MSQAHSVRLFYDIDDPAVPDGTVTDNEVAAYRGSVPTVGDWIKIDFEDDHVLQELVAAGVATPDSVYVLRDVGRALGKGPDGGFVEWVNVTVIAERERPEKPGYPISHFLPLGWSIPGTRTVSEEEWRSAKPLATGERLGDMTMRDI